MRPKHSGYFEQLVQSEGYVRFSRKLMIYSLIVLLLGIVLWAIQGQFSNPAVVCGLGCISVLFFLKSFEKPLWSHRLLWWGLAVLILAALFLGAHWPGSLNFAVCGAALVIVAAVLTFVNKQNQE